MKSIFFFVLLSIAVLPDRLLSQADSTGLANRKAITFTFSGLYLGGGLAARYWFAEDYCFRVGLTGSFESSEAKNLLADSSDYQSNTKYTRFGWSLGISRHMTIGQSLSPYFGVGVGYTYSLNNYESVYLYKISASKEATRSFNGQIFLGIEYWLTGKITLSGEQNLSASYSNGTYSNVFRISNSTSTLLLSLYF